MGEVEYSLSQRSFHVTLLRGLPATELEEVCQRLHRTLSRAEALEAEKVRNLHVCLYDESQAGRSHLATNKFYAYSSSNRQTQALTPQRSRTVWAVADGSVCVVEEKTTLTLASPDK